MFVNVLLGIFALGVVGAVIGVVLSLASKVFYVYVDPKIEAVEDALPGANCGGCGYPGCGANAEAIVQGKSSPSSCVAGGPEVAEEIAAIMGVKIEAREPDIALPGCRYGIDDADLKYIYNGVNDCRAAMLLGGGAKVCYAGCLGLGTCARACPFGAITMGPDHLPVVDEDLCTGCGTCERVCPKHIITLSSNSRKMCHEYTTLDCTTPCQRACPAGIDIPSYIHEIAQGNFMEAVRVIKQRNPFPSVCGRVCIHPCEEVCRRGLVDAPIAINDLKRFATDYERNTGRWVQVDRAPETGKKMAVIGAGVEGMTAAYFLNRLGHEVAVYESTSQLGGLLRTGIPENRLPGKIIDWDMEGIMDAGVVVHTQSRLGKDFSIGSLIKEENAAVFVATGGWDTRLSEKAAGGAPLPGVGLLLEFIMDMREGRSVNVGKRVVIVEGGRAALEGARACLAKGASSVTVLFRRSKEQCGISAEQWDQAESEGIRIMSHIVLSRIMGEGDRLTHAEIMTTTGETMDMVETDTILTGAGRFPELIYVPRVAEDVEDTQGVEAWQTVIPYAGIFAKDDFGMFREGEVASDYKAVVEAVGSGRRAASSVQAYVSGEPVAAPEYMIRKYTEVMSLTTLEPVPKAQREKMPELTQEEQLKDPTKEIALGFSEEQTRLESNRCLQCGLICYRRPKKTLQ